MKTLSALILPFSLLSILLTISPAAMALCIDKIPGVSCKDIWQGTTTAGWSCEWKNNRAGDITSGECQHNTMGTCKNASGTVSRDNNQQVRATVEMSCGTLKVREAWLYSNNSVSGQVRGNTGTFGHGVWGGIK